jgi:hypothetical protein
MHCEAAKQRKHRLKYALNVCLQGRMMAEQSLAAVLCQADRAVGLAAARNGSKVLLTVQGDGVISYDTSKLVSAVQPGYGVCPVTAAVAIGD